MGLIRGAAKCVTLSLVMSCILSFGGKVIAQRLFAPLLALDLRERCLVGRCIGFRQIQFLAIVLLNHCSFGLALKRKELGVIAGIGRISFMISNVSVCSAQSSVQHNKLYDSVPTALRRLQVRAHARGVVQPRKNHPQHLE